MRCANTRSRHDDSPTDTQADMESRIPLQDSDLKVVEKKNVSITACFRLFNMNRLHVRVIFISTKISTRFIFFVPAIFPGTKFTKISPTKIENLVNKQL